MTRFVVHHDALLHLATTTATLAGGHELLAPTSVRSHLLSRLHESVHRGELTAAVARERLAYVRGLRMRLLGDAVMQRQAWEIADRLGWSSTYEAEYIALTVLQADALVTLDDRLATAARELVAVEPIETLIA